ncbi:sensor domain-containing diguanylate cyclase [Cohnella soli]|uniref:Diguanylate cyclase n=1 Tax=Cohnella soli TaxID=425005 RepID=A0ABW0HPL5_9BACL
MGPRKGFKLRTIVNVIVMLTVISTVAIASFVAYRSERESLIRMTTQSNKLYADKIADTVDNLFVNMRASLNVTAQFLTADLSRPDLHDQLVFYQRSQTNFNSVFLIDKDGRLIEASNADPKNIGGKVESIGVKQALAARKPLVSEPYVSVQGNKLIVMVSVPFTDKQGQYAGFIGGSIRLHETSLFQTLLGNMPSVSNGTYAYVVSSNGTLLYHPVATRIGERVVGNKAIDRLITGHEGSMRIVNTAGIDMLASFASIREPGWGIVAQTPTRVALESARLLVGKIMMYMIPVMLVLLALIYWVTGKLSAPLSGLAAFASQLSPRNSSADELPRIHGMNFEANELHKAFGRAVRHFRLQYDDLFAEAGTDPLTGLHNRRTMDRVLKTWIADGRPFSLLVIDLDHFKQVNDTFGHDIGDEVLKFLADALRRLLWEDRIVCRFGGEEFVVLIPSEGVNETDGDAERIRAFAAGNVTPSGGIITVSIGMATYPNDSVSPEGLFRAADEALYEAKRKGRNRVEKASMHVLA